MKLKMNVSMAGANQVWVPGEIYEFDEATGKRLMEKGFAEKVEAPKAPAAKSRSKRTVSPKETRSKGSK